MQFVIVSSTPRNILWQLYISISPAFLLTEFDEIRKQHPFQLLTPTVFEINYSWWHHVWEGQYIGTDSLMGGGKIHTFRF